MQKQIHEYHVMCCHWLYSRCSYGYVTLRRHYYRPRGQHDWPAKFSTADRDEEQDNELTGNRVENIRTDRQMMEC